MLKQKITYQNFNDETVTKVLFFNISESDAQRMMMEEAEFTADENGKVNPEEIRNGMLSRIEGIMQRGKGSEILGLFDWLVRNSYGIIKDDGETFDNQDPEIYKAWRKTASYDAFFSKLMTDTDLMVEFFNGIFPPSWKKRMEEAKLDPEFAKHREALGSRGIPTV